MAGEAPYTLGDYFGVVRRRWIYLATVLPAALLFAVYLAFTLPTTYLSSATILLESSSIPENLVRTTVADYANQQLELIRRRVLTTDNLVGVAEEIDAYPERPDLSTREKARRIVQNTSTERVDPTTLEPQPESNALRISYEHADPDIAVEVARRLADLFVARTQASRAEQASETYGFLQERSEQVSDRIQELESRLADFKEEHSGSLPEDEARNEQLLDRAERELDTLQQELRQANEQRRSLEVELSQINPTLFDPDSGWRAELVALREELALARQRYTDDHPDVRRLRRSINELSARVEEQGPQQLVPDNPEYIQVQNQLDSVRDEIEALEARAARTREQMETYERRLQVTPEVEREYSQLQREYETARDRFASIEDSLSEAAMGQVLESEARGDRLTLLQPPYRPNDPYSPNRLGIILLGFVLGGGLGGGLAALAESTDPTLRSARDLAEITDIKPLAAIPAMPNQADRRKRALALGAASIIAALAVAFVASTVSQAV